MLKEHLGWGIYRLKRYFDWRGWFELLKVVDSELKVNQVNSVNHANLVNLKVNNSMLGIKDLMIENVIYEPLRAIGDAIGAEVKWDQGSDTASLELKK